MQRKDLFMKKTMIGILAGGLTAGVALGEAGSGAFATSLSLGLTVNQGNTDSSLGNAALVTESISGNREIRAGAEFTYGEQDSEKNTENGRVFVGVKEGLSDRAYVTADASGMYDPIASIDYRAIASVGLGYFLMKDEAASLSVDVGPAYIWEKVGGETEDYFGIRFAQRYTRDLSETAKVWQSLEYVPEAEDFENYLFLGEVGVEAVLNSRMSLRTVYRVTYDNEPAPDAKKSDRQLLAGLVIRL